MKFGFGTIAWGPRIDNLEATLDIIAAAGYQGVEFSQPPGRLGDIDTLLGLLQERSLVLLGLGGGSLLERIEFCKAYREAYLIVYDWHPHAQFAIDQNFDLALHPHIYHDRHHLSDALELLKQHPPLKLLPDTAILTIAETDPLMAIRKALQLGQNRLAAVHLKDWSPEFGRSAHRYARGFTRLGKGEVPIQDILDELQQAEYDGWVIIDHVSPRNDPFKYAFSAANWLNRRGLLSSAGRAHQEVTVSRKKTTQQERTLSPDSEAFFMECMMRASNEDLSKCYESIVEAFGELIPSYLITLWTCNPAKDLMSLLAVYPLSAAATINPTVQFHNSLSAIAIERQLTTRFTLTDTQPGKAWGYPNAKFARQELLSTLPLTQMISVPILSDSNPLHARLMVNIFPQDGNCPISDEDLSRLGAYVSIAADSALDERCSYAVAKTNIAATKSNITSTSPMVRVTHNEQVQDFLKTLTNLIQQFLKCEFITIFLVNDTGDKLELAATNTQISWNVDASEQFYKKGEGLTGTVWATKEARLTTNPHKEPDHVGKSQEPWYEPFYSYLCSPLIDHTGEVVGVVRCHQKKPDAKGSFSMLTHKTSDAKGSFSMFTYDDVAIIDAIGQAAAPHIQLLRTNERRARALNRMTHELKHPLGAIQGAASRMQSNLRRRNISLDQIFNHDYIKNILSYSALMSRLIDNADFLRQASSGVPLVFEKTLLMADVIAPTVQQINGLLIERDFPVRGIHYGSFSNIPALWIDKNRFQQVIFNLLSNAIKYAYRDPGAFNVDIHGVEMRNWYLIRFRDWGTGVEEGLEEIIFNEGYRTKEAQSIDVTGQGLGLWIVRQIIEAHGGRIVLTRNRYPTEFIIYLPISLSSVPPRVRESTNQSQG